MTPCPCPPRTEAFLDPAPEVATIILAGLDWGNITPRQAALGLACLRGEADMVRMLVGSNPEFLSQPCGHWSMGKWLGVRDFTPPIRPDSTPLEIALLAGQYKAALALLDHPVVLDNGKGGPEGGSDVGFQELLFYIASFRPVDEKAAVGVFRHLYAAGFQPAWILARLGLLADEKHAMVGGIVDILEPDLPRLLADDDVVGEIVSSWEEVLAYAQAPQEKGAIGGMLHVVQRLLKTPTPPHPRLLDMVTRCCPEVLSTVEKDSLDGNVALSSRPPSSPVRL